MSLGEYAKLVAAPTFFPYCCEECGAQKGPLVDTGVDRPAMGGHVRVFHCRSCVRDMAKMLGYVEGERAEKLDKASDLLEQVQQNERKMNEHIVSLQKELGERDSALALADAELERLRASEEQIRFRAAQLQDTASELVAP